jgi:hypothetical protein
MSSSMLNCTATPTPSARHEGPPRRRRRVTLPDGTLIIYERCESADVGGAGRVFIIVRDDDAGGVALAIARPGDRGFDATRVVGRVIA